jgi:putative hemolysin
VDGLGFSVVLVLLLILLGGFFAASELALVSLRPSQVERLEGTGRRGRRVAHLRSDPNRFLSSVQIGVTLCGFLSAAYGGAAFATRLTPVLRGWGLQETVAYDISLVAVTAAISYLSLVLGELVPKRLALQRAEGVALVAAPVLDRLATAARPLIWLLSRSTDVVVRLLGLDPKAHAEEVSEEELRHLVGTHEELGSEQRQVFAEVFDAADRQLTDVMVPRTQAAFLEAATPLGEAARQVVGQPHSRYPVIRDDADHVIGFVHVRDLLTAVADCTGPSRDGVRPATVADIVRPILALPGTNTVLSTLMQLRSGAGHIAVVVDEYGGTDGIVTLEDLIEELVGEIQDEFDQRLDRRPAAGATSHELEARLHRDDLADLTGIQLPEGRYETLGGFVMSVLQRIPAVGDRVDHDGHRYTVTEMDGRRPVRVRITPVPAPALPSPGTTDAGAAATAPAAGRG